MTLSRSLTKSSKITHHYPTENQYLRTKPQARLQTLLIQKLIMTYHNGIFVYSLATSFTFMNLQLQYKTEISGMSRISLELLRWFSVMQVPTTMWARFYTGSTTSRLFGLPNLHASWFLCVFSLQWRGTETLCKTACLWTWQVLRIIGWQPTWISSI